MDGITTAFKFFSVAIWLVFIGAASVGVMVGVWRRHWVVGRGLVETPRQADKEAKKWGFTTVAVILSLGLPALMLFSWLSFV
ncbi:hypothetical protein [Neisseria sp. S1]|uniref:hypothetical protein n=1 Tax=Neisseria sp. S1 TaxID=3318354 RepID=UPI003A861911